MNSSTHSEHDVTALLHAWAAGDESVLRQLTPLVYPELKRLARYHLRGNRQHLTMQPTALVHEVWLRLARQSRLEARTRAHFLAFAANIMRQILVDHARAVSTAKRGGNAVRVPICDEKVGNNGSDFLDFLELNSALDGLARFDARKARMIELRFFGGLTGEEIAELMHLGTATITREIRLAQAWLKQEMSKRESRRLA